MFTMFSSNRESALSHVLNDCIKRLKPSTVMSGECVLFCNKETFPMTAEKWELIKNFLINNKIQAFVCYAQSTGCHGSTQLKKETVCPNGDWRMYFDVSKRDLINQIKLGLDNNDNKSQVFMSGLGSFSK